MGASGITIRDNTEIHTSHKISHHAQHMIHTISLFQPILLALTILSATNFEIAVSFPTYFPERDSGFSEAKHEIQFPTESKITKEIPYDGDIDENRRNLLLGDESDVNNQNNGATLDYNRDNSISDQGHGVFMFLKPSGNRGRISSRPSYCNDFNITCIIIYL
jgi:hypothetical protein